jgi:hypothetical protein
MNAQIVSYFTSRNIRVMLAIGGITFVPNWNNALAANPTQLGLNAAAAAKNLGVGIEIDYEENLTPNLSGLQAFINAYRSQLPYDATGANPAARLTIDVGAGDRFLIGIDQMASSAWLTTTNPILDYANALVPSKQPTSATAAENNWLEHVDGKPNFAPPIPPLAPAKFTGSLFITDSTKLIPECSNFSSSLEDSTGSFVQTVAPAGAGTTSGMLGYMFWAAECPSTRNVCTVPPDSCQGGVGVGSKTYNIPLPMPALRQQ